MMEFIQFTENQAANRAALAKGIKGVRCIDVRNTITEEESREYLGVVSVPGAFISSVEVYANGAVNAYVRKIGYPWRQFGFVRVRDGVHAGGGQLADIGKVHALLRWD